MSVVISTLGKFHSFDLARELHRRGQLTSIFSGYPRFKLRQEGLPDELIHSFPWVHAPYMAASIRTRLGTRFSRQWELIDRQTFGRFVARRIPDCDVYIGLSSAALEAAQAVKSQGGAFVCDRGSTHIRVQDQILREEHDRWGIQYLGIDPRIIEREESEYEISDRILVPSTFAKAGFIEADVAYAKVAVVPYGADLSRFSKRGNPEDGRFDVLFVGAVSLQKGIPYLLQAFRKLEHPFKRLTLVGVVDPKLLAWLRANRMLESDVQMLGPVSQAEVASKMSAAHVLVLPSVQDGFGMVIGQALACGCPVIATTNTGAPDFNVGGTCGFVVPPRDVDALAESMQRLADDSGLQKTFSREGLSVVKEIGGWSRYGDGVSSVVQSLSADKS